MTHVTSLIGLLMSSLTHAGLFVSSLACAKLLWSSLARALMCDWFLHDTWQNFYWLLNSDSKT